jgi:hypothetical protein
MDPISIALMLASKFAPDIIKYFTNSDTAGSVAGQVIDIAKTVTGKGDPDEAVAALTADPALALQFKTSVMANDTELEKAYLADTQNARQQTIDLAKEGSAIAWGAPIVSTLIVLGYFACIWLLFGRGQDMPTNIFQLVNVMFGGLSLAFGQVCNYWLGSSSGSKKSGDAVRAIAITKLGKK